MYSPEEPLALRSDRQQPQLLDVRRLCPQDIGGRGEHHLACGGVEGEVREPRLGALIHADYFAHSAGTRALLEKLAGTKPRTLACMHGSAWSGDGGRLLLDLADALSPVTSG